MRNSGVTSPWVLLDVFRWAATKLKQEAPVPKYVGAIADATSEYERQVRILWEAFKRAPTAANARRLADAMKRVSEEYWPEAAADILGLDIEDMTSRQRRVVDEAIEEHSDFIDSSLLPDLLRVFSEGGLLEPDQFNVFDHRILLMYPGALWSLGFLLTVTFDGTSLRDLADVFVFIGPHDELTCTGERGCAQFKNKPYTVAQIIAEQIIPGRLQCLTNCRDMLIPIASPFAEEREKSFGRVVQIIKGGPGSGFHGHSGRPGKRGGSAAAQTVFPRIEDTMISLRGKAKKGLPDGEYHAVASYGNINGAKAKAGKLGTDTHKVIRNNGKYWVVEVKESKFGVATPTTPPPKPKVKPEPKPVAKPEGKTARQVFEERGVVRGGSAKSRALVNETLDKIPAWHVEGSETSIGVGRHATKRRLTRVTEITVVDKRNVNKEFLAAPGEGTLAKGEVILGFANTTTGTMTVGVSTKGAFLERSSQKTVAHEVGHHVFQGRANIMTRDIDPRISKASVGLKRLYIKRDKEFGTEGKTGRGWAGKTVSSYATSSISEFKAEIYGYYVRDPGDVRRADPEAYAIIKEMF